MPDFEGKPFRMRGYYRAVKRGDAWAVRIANIKNPLAFFFALVYRNVNIKELVYTKNPFWDLQPKEDCGAYLPVPIKFDSSE